jgi:DNA-binding NtrC family response regulator
MAETVMSIGDDPQLLSLRHAVLELAGYHVITESNAHAASQKIASAPCDVLLLCYSMDINVRQRLAREFREHCPDGRIIAITNQHQATPPVDADAFLYGVEGAESLLEIVREQMDARTQ